MSKKTKDLINKIESLEQLLRELKIDLAEATGPSVELQVGDRVRIRNPSRGQPHQGVITKVHPTKRATVQGTDAKNKETKVIRLLKNLEKIQDGN